MAKITDFKVGDKIRRKIWSPGIFVHLEPYGPIIYHIAIGVLPSEQVYTIHAGDLLAHDWESYSGKIKKEGWINIYSYDVRIMQLTGNMIYETKERATERDDPNRIATVKIEWEG